MSADRRTTVLAGVLYFLGLVAGVFSMVPVIDLPDYLAQIPANAGQVLWGAFFQFHMMVAFVGMGLALYPILKRYSESLALGYVGFRLVAAAFIVLGVILLLLLLTLGQEYAKAGAPAASHFQTLGELLRSGRDWANHIGTILSLSLSGLMLYGLLYHKRLVPRWLAGWGLVGTALTAAASFFFMFRLVDLFISVYMNLPLALLEMVFAIWLIAKGVTPAAIASRSAQTGMK